MCSRNILRSRSFYANSLPSRLLVPLSNNNHCSMCCWYSMSSRVTCSTSMSSWLSMWASGRISYSLLKWYILSYQHISGNRVPWRFILHIPIIHTQSLCCRILLYRGSFSCYSLPCRLLLPFQHLNTNNLPKRSILCQRRVNWN
jgi:hypothetical protein